MCIRDRDKVVFTGDILFNGGHPIVWAGPVDNWIRACDLMLSWDVEVVVPGHGPVTDKSSVRELKHYLEYVKAEARKRYDMGMTLEQAVDDILVEGVRLVDGRGAHLRHCQQPVPGIQRRHLAARFDLPVQSDGAP